MKRVIVFSGGLDSTVVLARALRESAPGDEVLAVAYQYGQRHERELIAAQAIADFYLVQLRVVDVRGLIEGKSTLLGHGDIPRGHYRAETMRSTVVHGRNMLFASIAVSLAGEGGEVWMGVHSGDHHIYPDCRPEFWSDYSQAASYAYGVSVRLPFLHSTKTAIVQAGVDAAAPLHLTWSCYNGGDAHCGTCGTCVERREAFDHAGQDDPTEYENE